MSTDHAPHDTTLSNAADPQHLIRDTDALVVIDMQNDFSPGGSCPIADLDAVVPIINQWIDDAQRRGCPVIATRDWHPDNHITFEGRGGDLPPHCVQGTRGVDFHPLLSLPQDAIIISKCEDAENASHSAFTDPHFADRLQQLGVERLLVAGVAEEHAVRETCLDAIAAGFDVHLVPGATKPLNPTNAAAAIMELKQAGASTPI
jgi:nicotinamidase/pyrazinamidase